MGTGNRPSFFVAIALFAAVALEPSQSSAVDRKPAQTKTSAGASTHDKPSARPAQPTLARLERLKRDVDAFGVWCAKQPASAFKRVVARMKKIARDYRSVGESGNAETRLEVQLRVLGLNDVATACILEPPPVGEPADEFYECNVVGGCWHVHGLGDPITPGRSELEDLLRIALSAGVTGGIVEEAKEWLRSADAALERDRERMRECLRKCKDPDEWRLDPSDKRNKAESIPPR